MLHAAKPSMPEGGINAVSWSEARRSVGGDVPAMHWPGPPINADNSALTVLTVVALTVDSAGK